MLLNRLPDRCQDIAVLNHVVEVIVAGDDTRRPTIVSPQRVAVRNLLPLIPALMIGVDLVPRDIRKLVSGLIEFVETVELVEFFLNRVSPLPSQAVKN